MNLKLMIVDDEQPARRRLRELLDDIRTDIDHEIVGEATNGVEAVALTRELGPDLVLADMQMPR